MGDANGKKQATREETEDGKISEIEFLGAYMGRC